MGVIFTGEPMASHHDVAEALRRLTYANMMQLADDLMQRLEQLRSAKGQVEADDLAHILNDWADATLAATSTTATVELSRPQLPSEALPDQGGGLPNEHRSGVVSSADAGHPITAEVHAASENTVAALEGERRPRGGSKQRWAEHDAVLKHLVAEGKSYDEIAQQLGRSTDAVRLRASRLGLTQPRSKSRAANEGAQPERVSLGEVVRFVRSRGFEVLGQAPVFQVDRTPTDMAKLIEMANRLRLKMGMEPFEVVGGNGSASHEQ